MAPLALCPPEGVEVGSGRVGHLPLAPGVDVAGLAQGLTHHSAVHWG